ncbi:hypothetical protein [Draconibacterium sediminis]|uniref:hypothetical protein n=1 Tax=Draconibacterium sediminis TaxID=1544798 RepID=UPI0026ED4C91|nr:hypothetical protein [Draconibacterium sediminis]
MNKKYPFADGVVKQITSPPAGGEAIFSSCKDSRADRFFCTVLQGGDIGENRVQALAFNENING